MEWEHNHPDKGYEFWQEANIEDSAEDDMGQITT